jgi:hypothetical protein
MKTAGVILDLYDNVGDLKTLFPSLDVIPQSVKEAHFLTAEERERLPDDSFAVVLLNGEDRLRKYACIDQGNTELSVAYFVKHGHKLPVEAQQVAADNLAIACSWYGIEVPDMLQKQAFLNTAMTALTAPALVKGTASKLRSNVAAVRAGDGVVTPRQQQAVGDMLKGAEVSGTSLAPSQPMGDLTDAGARKPSQSNTSAMKSAAAGEQYEKAPQMKLRTLKPHVDVTNKEPPTKLVEKKASFHAYQGVYPLDTHVQVKTASQYFDDNYRGMPFDMKREYASALVKRASSIGVPVSDYARSCGADGYASAAQMRVAVDNRLLFVDEKQASVLNQLFANRDQLPPDDYCNALAEFDKLAEIDWRYGRYLMDPVESTFGIDKIAQDEGDSWSNGNDYITKQQIENYAVTAFSTLTSDYGPDFAKEFKKDAWAVFNSMPLEQKRRLARAAGDNSATGLHDVA